jgi:hypothetical protein
VRRRRLVLGGSPAGRGGCFRPGGCLPGATSKTQLYAEDINDQLQQVVADFTAIEERCIALLGLHAALASSTWRA